MFSLHAMFAAVTLALCHQMSATIAPPRVITSVPRPTDSSPTHIRRMSAADDKRSVQEAWDRHFKAFSEQDLETIVLDYDEHSVITTYNQSTGTKNIYEGVEGARALFTGMFTAFTDGKDLDTLVADVSEEGRTVLFVWRITAAGFQDGTDYFVFGRNNKIHRQAAVVRTG